MGKQDSWGWASYDVDDDNGDDYCAKTDVRPDGTVHRYDATGGSFGKGHGHAGYSGMGAFLAGDKEGWSRGPNDPGSIGRPWEDRY